MKLGVQETFFLGIPDGIVKLKYGVEECPAASFKQYWNNGRPSIHTPEEKTIQGQTDTGMLECELDIPLDRFIMEKVGHKEWDSSKSWLFVDLMNRQISMAIPFDGGKRYAVGVLKFEVKKTEV